MRTAMACLVAGFCLVSVVQAPAVQAADDDGEKVVSKKGGFSAVFPKKPELKEQKDGEQYILEDKEKMGAYLLQFNKFDKEIDAENEEVAKKVLDATQDAVVKSFPGAKLASSKDVEDADTPTRIVEIAIGDDGYYNAVLMLDNEKLYHIAVLGKKDFAKSKEAKAFLESFEAED
jgi:hypothetical protein